MARETSRNHCQTSDAPSEEKVGTSFAWELQRMGLARRKAKKDRTSTKTFAMASRMQKEVCPLCGLNTGPAVVDKTMFQLQTVALPLS
jgi:hypothetical protein